MSAWKNPLKLKNRFSSMDIPTDPVCTACDHYFCKTCFKKLLGTKARETCPLCKSGITKRSLKQVAGFQYAYAALKELLAAIYEESGWACTFSQMESERVASGQSLFSKIPACPMIFDNPTPVKPTKVIEVEPPKRRRRRCKTKSTELPVTVDTDSTSTNLRKTALTKRNLRRTVPSPAKKRSKSKDPSRPAENNADETAKRSRSLDEPRPCTSTALVDDCQSPAKKKPCSSSTDDQFLLQRLEPGPGKTRNGKDVSKCAGAPPRAPTPCSVLSESGGSILEPNVEPGSQIGQPKVGQTYQANGDKVDKAKQTKQWLFADQSNKENIPPVGLDQVGLPPNENDSEMDLGTSAGTLDEPDIPDSQPGEPVETYREAVAKIRPEDMEDSDDEDDDELASKFFKHRDDPRKTSHKAAKVTTLRPGEESSDPFAYQLSQVTPKKVVKKRKAKRKTVAKAPSPVPAEEDTCTVDDVRLFDYASQSQQVTNKRVSLLSPKKGKKAKQPRKGKGQPNPKPKRTRRQKKGEKVDSAKEAQAMREELEQASSYHLNVLFGKKQEGTSTTNRSSDEPQANGVIEIREVSTIPDHMIMADNFDVPANTEHDKETTPPSDLQSILVEQQPTVPTSNLDVAEVGLENIDGSAETESSVDEGANLESNKGQLFKRVTTPQAKSVERRSLTRNSCKTGEDWKHLDEMKKDLAQKKLTPLRFKETKPTARTRRKASSKKDQKKQSMSPAKQPDVVVRDQAENVNLTSGAVINLIVPSLAADTMDSNVSGAMQTSEERNIEPTKEQTDPVSEDIAIEIPSTPPTLPGTTSPVTIATDDEAVVISSDADDNCSTHDIFADSGKRDVQEDDEDSDDIDYEQLAKDLKSRDETLKPDDDVVGRRTKNVILDDELSEVVLDDEDNDVIRPTHNKGSRLILEDSENLELDACETGVTTAEVTDPALDSEVGKTVVHSVDKEPNKTDAEVTTSKSSHPVVEEPSVVECEETQSVAESTNQEEDDAVSDVVLLGSEEILPPAVSKHQGDERSDSPAFPPTGSISESLLGKISAVPPPPCSEAKSSDANSTAKETTVVSTEPRAAAATNQLTQDLNTSWDVDVDNLSSQQCDNLAEHFERVQREMGFIQKILSAVNAKRKKLEPRRADSLPNLTEAVEQEARTSLCEDIGIQVSPDLRQVKSHREVATTPRHPDDVNVTADAVTGTSPNVGNEADPIRSPSATQPPAATSDIHDDVATAAHPSTENLFDCDSSPRVSPESQEYLNGAIDAKFFDEVVFTGHDDTSVSTKALQVASDVVETDANGAKPEEATKLPEQADALDEDADLFWSPFTNELNALKSQWSDQGNGENAVTSSQPETEDRIDIGQATNLLPDLLVAPPAATLDNVPVPAAVPTRPEPIVPPTTSRAAFTSHLANANQRTASPTVRTPARQLFPDVAPAIPPRPISVSTSAFARLIPPAAASTPYAPATVRTPLSARIQRMGAKLPVLRRMNPVQPRLSFVPQAPAAPKVASPTVTSSVDGRAGQIAIVGSGLTATQREAVQRFTQVFKVKMTSKFQPAQTTHVIVQQVGDRLVCDRTLKVFLGIAGHCWVVSWKWVEDSLNKGYLLEEGKYEMIGDTVTGEHHGPAHGRLSRQSLLDGYQIYCYGQIADLPLADLRSLVDLCGGALMNQPSDFSTLVDSQHRVVVTQLTAATIPVAELQDFREKRGATVVSREWLLDSVSLFQVRPFDTYLLTNTSQQQPPPQ